jgi:hypothetical protein
VADERPTVKELREGLADAASRVDGVRTSAYAKDTVNVPEVHVLPPAEINFDRTFGGGAEYSFPVRIYAARSSEREAQEVLDAYISEEGKGSLKAALENDQTLGTRASWVAVRQMRAYGTYTFGDVRYLGAELLVSVYA